MKTASILCLFLIAFVGCLHTPVSKEADFDFQTHQDSLNQLRAMLREDAEGSFQFIVGPQTFGNVAKGRSGWLYGSPRRTVAASYEAALAEEGLSKERHDQYLTLLDEVGAESIKYETKPEGGQTTLHLSRSTFAECSTTVEVRDDRSIPESGLEGRVSVDSGSWREITPLGSGWYLNQRCPYRDEASL